MSGTVIGKGTVINSSNEKIKETKKEFLKFKSSEFITVTTEKDGSIGIELNKNFTDKFVCRTKLSKELLKSNKVSKETTKQIKELKKVIKDIEEKLIEHKNVVIDFCQKESEKVSGSFCLKQDFNSLKDILNNTIKKSNVNEAILKSSRLKLKYLVYSNIIAFLCYSLHLCF